MTARQRIVRERREYNQWVANQTLEDYALRFTAKRARKWSALRVANTALGSISFLALEAIGGTITVAYGFTNSVAAILVVSLLIFAISLPICYYAARDGVDIDLLTRGAGFGYIGSTITSLIYASFTFIFFGIESVIVASMLATFFAIPLWLGYILCAAAVLPLVTHGITLISRFQLWTQPVWFVLNVIALGAALLAHPDWVPGWMRYEGTGPTATAAFNPLYFGACASILLALITQTAEQVDYLRFLPPRTARKNGAWWTALLAGGPGWIVFDVFKLLAGSFLAYGAARLGVSPEAAVRPAQMYLMAFGDAVKSPIAALILTSFFVVLSQLKINVTNAYAGSIAWSNFFSRLTHSHPGRVVWLVFNIAIALLLMELGAYETIQRTLVLYSDVATAWIGALVADLIINKPLGFSPPGIEFKRAHLYDINPVGVGAMLLAVVVSLAAWFGAFGEFMSAMSTFTAFLVAFVTAPLIAWGDRRPLLFGPQTPDGVGCQGIAAMLDLRTRIRAGGHGVLPRLYRADLLAVLLARRPLQRRLQTPRAGGCADHDHTKRGISGRRDAGVAQPARPVSPPCSPSSSRRRRRSCSVSMPASTPRTRSRPTWTRLTQGRSGKPSSCWW